MKTITVHRVELEFEADQVTDGDDEAQARQAIDLVNFILQSGPFGLKANLIAHRDEIEIQTEESPD